MKNRRIIYILLPFAFPAGGVAVIYEHVEILSRHGFRAFVALPEKPAVDFYQTKAPLLIHHGNLNVQPGDIYVIPEDFRDYMEALRNVPARKIMFCQNQYYLPFSDNPSAGFAEYHVDGLIVSSESLRNFFGDVYAMHDVPLIPCAVDTGLFSAKPHKVRQIAYMPRKLPAEAAFIEATFKRMYKEYAEIPWVSISNKTRREAAGILGISEVFLSLSHKDSFGLPPLEAMACGCLVAGFHGDGGREYMNDRNGWWAETGDWLGAVRGLAKALKLAEKGGGQLEELRGEMARTVGRYSTERMQRELLGFWEQEIRTPFN